MRTGDLDTVIEIWTPTETAASSGQVIKTYAKLISLFANVMWKTGQEQYEGEQKVSVTGPVITVYSGVSTFNSQALVKMAGLFYSIENIIPDKTRFYLEMVCKVRDNQNVGL